MCSYRQVFGILALATFATAHIVRRQADDSADDDTDGQAMDLNGKPVWDAYIRDKYEKCHAMAQKAPTVYCELFTQCCDMNFDPLNGDRCQQKELVCNAGPDGKPLETAVCILRNCTEMITTTTTTTPKPVVQSKTKSAFGTTVSSVLLLTVAYVLH